MFSMKGRRTKWVILQLIGGVLIVGVTLLGLYQYRWISEAMLAEEQRIRRDISNSFSRGIDEAFDEVRALISYAYVTSDDIAAENWGAAHESIQLWARQSEYPNLLKDTYILPLRADEVYWGYNSQEGRFEPKDVAHTFDRYTALLDENPTDIYRKATAFLSKSGYFLVPINSGMVEADVRRRPDLEDTTAFLAVSINIDLLFSEIVPTYLSQYVGNYDFRIIQGNSPVYSSFDVEDEDREADGYIPLDGIVDFEAMNHIFSERREAVDSADSALKSPLNRFWFIRTVGIPSISMVPGESHGRPAPPSRLEVFYPDRSLKSAMKARKTISLSLSIGTLLIFLGGYFTLYHLLRRAESMRVRERIFVTSMSHELRTPLSVISATSDNLVHGIVADKDRIKRYGRLISQQAERLGKMVESILLYSGVELMDSSKVRLGTVSIRLLIHDVINALTPTADEVGMTIRPIMDTKIDEIRSDADALTIIMKNLLVNSLRYGAAPDGEGEVRIEIRIRPPRTLFIIVEDDGQGIAPGEIKPLFEPFTRGERSKSDQLPGSGLGLHIVQKAVEHVGGHIKVESPYDDMAGISKRGARFTVKVPVRIERQDETENTNS